jgi:hypothetical protein
MEIGLVQGGVIVNVIEIESVGAARIGAPGMQAYLERKPGQGWGPGWTYADGLATSPDGQVEEVSPALREISLNEFMARLPDQVIDALLDMEANPVDQTGREVRRAMLRFRLAKNQTLELDSPLLLGFVPMLKAFGLSDEQVAAVLA